MSLRGFQFDFTVHLPLMATELDHIKSLSNMCVHHN